jgi:hypothetical protein
MVQNADGGVQVQIHENLALFKKNAVFNIYQFNMKDV